MRLYSVFLLVASVSLNCAEWRRYGPRDDMDLLLLKAQPAYQSNGPRLPNLRGSLQSVTKF